MDVAAWRAACETDEVLAAETDAACDPSQLRGRWTCPGRHCGSYQGYKYGCKEPECAATVKPYKAAQRAARGIRPRVVIDEEVRQTVLAEVRRGRSLAAACETAGVTPFRIGGARRADPEFDAALIAAADEGGLLPRLQPVRQLHCPGDCGTVGWRYGCREATCREAHSAAIRTAPSRQYSRPARRFGPDDAAAVLDHLRAGRTIGEAVQLTGWSYDALSTARKQDPVLDAAVTAAWKQSRTPGEPGEHAREVSRIDRTSREQ